MKSNLASLFSTSMSGGSNGDEDALKYVAPTASTIRPDLAPRTNTNATKSRQNSKPSQEMEEEEPVPQTVSSKENLGQLPQVTKPAAPEIIHNATVKVSFSSSTMSARMVTSSVFVVSPGLKVSVPLAAV